MNRDINFENEMEIEFLALPENEITARNAVASFVVYLDPSTEEIAEIKTAVSEAVTNCIIHGYEETKEGVIKVKCKVSYDKKLYITVTDEGKGIENIEEARKPLFTTGNYEERSGMGFTVMESFMDRVEVYSQVMKGTSVEMVKNLGYTIG